MATRLVVTGAGLTGVYDDRLAPIYAALGTLRVKRASEVEYDDGRGEWVAVSVETGEEISSGANRAGVIAAEVRWLEARLPGRREGERR